MANEHEENGSAGASYSPGPREVGAAVIGLWKEDKATENLSYAKLLAAVKNKNPTWTLSEKRLKATLKEFNLQPNPPLFTYVKETESSATPQLPLPATVKLVVTKSRGKGLYAARNIKKDQLLWEEAPLVRASPVEFVRLMRSGHACAYCAKTLRTAEGVIVNKDDGIRCSDCKANWCCMECKRRDLVHADTWHDVYRNKFSVNAWRAYEQFCMDNNWKAGYLYGLTLLYKIKNDPRRPGIASNIASMAKIRQDIRQKAVSTEGSLEFEQHEHMWKKGYELLLRVVRPVYKLTYDEYIEGIGLVNINNLDGCIFLAHSHLNHNCDPNVAVEIVSPAEGIKVVALRDIPAGQELVTTYVNPEMPFDERKYKLRINWGFICGCDRCKKEANEAPESPTETGGRKRTKSVHFDKNPVTGTVAATS